ncbi:MAG: phosphate signaling complex protein PhoU [Phycisphaerae bacterium]
MDFSILAIIMTVHFVSLLDQLRRRSLRMASQVEDMLHESSEVLFSADEAIARRVMARDQEIDEEEVAVEAEVIRLLALYQPVGSDLRLLTTILKVTNDLERVADCTVNIAERAQHLEVQELARENEYLKRLAPLVRRALRNAVQAYSSENADAAREVIERDVAIDALYAQIVRHVVATAPKTPEHIAAHIDLLSVAKNLERIADHATNIAEDVVYLITGAIVRHRQQETED